MNKKILVGSILMGVVLTGLWGIIVWAIGREMQVILLVIICGLIGVFGFSFLSYVLISSFLGYLKEKIRNKEESNHEETDN